MVSAPEAFKTSELTVLPVSLRYLASRYLAAIDATSTMIAGVEYSTSSGVTMFLMDNTMISPPTAMIMSAMMMVVMRSIDTLCFDSLRLEAIFSQMMMRKPDTESVRLCIASEAIARELDSRPIIRLNMANRKFTNIKR